MQKRGDDGQRELFLDRGQRRALLDACSGGLRDLVEAVALLGLRPGEAVALTRADFELRLGTLKITGKTGEREITLPPAALALFKRLAHDKIGAAPLLMRTEHEPWKHRECVGARHPCGGRACRAAKWRVLVFAAACVHHRSTARRHADIGRRTLHRHVAANDR